MFRNTGSAQGGIGQRLLYLDNVAGPERSVLGSRDRAILAFVGSRNGNRPLDVGLDKSRHMLKFSVTKLRFHRQRSLDVLQAFPRVSELIRGLPLKCCD